MIRLKENRYINTDSTRGDEAFSKVIRQKVYNYHQSLPGYQMTPLESLDQLAGHLQIDKLWVKNEAGRFDLNAFKGLGASYAVAAYFAERLNLDLENLSFEELNHEISRADKVTLATATDGNHGKSLAWAARLFNQDAVVYMPKGSSPERLEAIRSEGARAEMTELNYDATVKLIAEEAEEEGWVVIQDTAWEGYEKIPLWIMQGYSTLVSEIRGQLAEELETVTHVILQAGVGSFAAAVLSSLLSELPDKEVQFIIVESDQADPFFQSAHRKDGQAVSVEGDLATIMAGLACGKASSTAWEVLKEKADFFASCSDEVSARGMRVLGNPLMGDPAIRAGESGAVPVGFLYEVIQNPHYQDLKTSLSLGKHARVLVINTEGDTDPENYRNIVWN